MVVRKPIREDLVLLGVIGIQADEIAGIEVRQRFHILAVDFLDPSSIFAGALTVADTDGH
jgi:hypothetical protein